MRSVRLILFATSVLLAQHLTAADGSAPQNGATASATTPAASKPVPVAPGLENRFTLAISGFYPKISTTVRLDNSNSDQGSLIDLENELGYDDAKFSWGLEANYNFSDSWSLRAGYIGLDRSASREIDREINWGDEVYEVGAVIDSFFNLQIFRLAAGYSFSQSETHNFGVLFGIHALDVSVGLNATGEGDLDSDLGGVEASTGGILPLPNAGFFWNQRLSDRWVFTSRVDWFGLKYENWAGNLWDVKVGFTYAATKNLVLGIGYTYFELGVDYSKESWAGEMEFQYLGPELSLAYGF